MHKFEISVKHVQQKTEIPILAEVFFLSLHGEKINVQDGILVENVANVKQ